MSALGSRSATIDGLSRPSSRRLTVKVCGPAAVRVTQLHTRPTSLHVPSMSDAAGLQAGQHPVPGSADLGLVVLPQHVERADDRRRAPGGQGHLEAAQPEADAGARIPGRSGDAFGVDLDADHLDVGSHPRQA